MLHTGRSQHVVGAARSGVVQMATSICTMSLVPFWRMPAVVSRLIHRVGMIVASIFMSSSASGAMILRLRRMRVMGVGSVERWWERPMAHLGGGGRLEWDDGRT
jgi:hypothetical protein